MPQYAHFDHATSSPSPVTGWYDTDAYSYPNLPAIADLLQITQTQWAARMNNPSGWAVSNGSLVSFTPPTPVPTLAQQAQSALMTGVAVTSTGSPALNGTYDISPAAQGRMASVSTYILVNGKFPGGTTTYAWIDTSGGIHIFPTTVLFHQFATAIADHVSTLDQIAILGTGTLPAASINIA